VHSNSARESEVTLESHVDVRAMAPHNFEFKACSASNRLRIALVLYFAISMFIYLDRAC